MFRLQDLQVTPITLTPFIEEYAPQFDYLDASDAAEEIITFKSYQL